MEARLRAVMSRLTRAIALLLLALWNVVFFMLAYLSFLRYDVQ